MIKQEPCHLADRLRWVRKKHDLSLETMARRIGVTTSYLSKLETGRSENPSGPVLSMICQTYSVRRDWLLRGEGSPFEAEFLNVAAEAGKVTDWSGFPYPLTIGEKANEQGLFIAALMMAGGQESADFLMRTLRHVLSNPLALPSVTVEVARLVAEQLERCLRTKPACTRPVPEVRTLQSVLAEGTIARRAYDSLLRETLGQQDSQNKPLTVTSLKSRTAVVKIRTLHDLLAALKSLASEPGRPASLARDLNVPQARVSEWLSGKKKPSGETTLRLLHWVEQQERKPETPGSAMNTAKGRTRVRKSPNEKRTTQVCKKG